MQTTQDRAEISFGRQSPARSHALLMSRLDVHVDYEVLHASKEGESIPLSVALAHGCIYAGVSVGGIGRLRPSDDTATPLRASRDGAARGLNPYLSESTTILGDRESPRAKQPIFCSRFRSLLTLAEDGITLSW